MCGVPLAWFDDLMVLPLSGVLMCTDVMARGVDFPAVDWVIQFDPLPLHGTGVWLWVCTCISSCMRAYIFSKSECVSV